MNCFPRKLLGITTALLCGGLAATSWASPPAPPQATPTPPATNSIDSSPGPRIVFAEPVHDFGKVSAGETVKATFLFTNAGDETLTITAVQPSCGCTAAGEWSRQVEPGKTGTIPIQFTTAGFGGPVAKSITVVSNDKTRPTTILQMKGILWKAVDVIPAYAVLNVIPEATGATSTISITNNTEQPLVLSQPEVNNKAFVAVLTTNEPGKSFRLAVSTTATNTGSVQGQIIMRTSSTNMPVITITAWANVQPVISVIPASINLPPPPLANRLTPIVTFINNTTNPITFSEPMVSLDDVQVQFREVQTNRYYTATLTFPQGFELPSGKAAEFVIKSTHPKYPTLRVPISQPPRQAVTQQQAPAVGQAARTPAGSGAMVLPAPPKPASTSVRPPHVLPRPAGLVAPPVPPQPTK
jgi:hypothetical protein